MNNLNSVFFTAADTGYVVGRDGTILKTTNGGTNWTAQTSGTTNVLNSIYFTDANTGYTVGEIGTILKTINSGTTSFTGTDTVSLQTFTGATLSGTTVTATIPAHSVVMLTLPPTVSIIGTSSFIPSNKSFNISTTPDRKIAVEYSVQQSTPVILSLYGVDGRLIGETFTGLLQPGEKNLVWQPGKVKLSAKVYFLKMKTDGFSETKRVVFER